MSRNITSNAPTQNRRSTRSQSRDTVDNGGIGSQRKRNGRRNAREVSVDSLVSEGENNARHSAKDKSVQDLPTVTEEASILYPTLPGNDGLVTAESTVKSAQQDGYSITKSPGNISVISGTTARTSSSAQDLVGLDHEEILDALPSLDYGANEVLKFVMPQNSDLESLTEHLTVLQNHKARQGKRLARLGDSLHLYKKPFGTDLYPNVSMLVKGLLGAQRMRSFQGGVWRPDNIFYKTNLATMMVQILLTQDDLTKKYSAVVTLERDFPRSFLSELSNKGTSDKTSIGKSKLYSESFELALELRTQHFIMLVYRYLHQPNFDPDIVLSQVFYEDRITLKGWNSDGLKLQDLSNANRKSILQRIERIKTTFNEDEPGLQSSQLVDLDRLISMYSWSAFLAKSLVWSRLRQVEIDVQLASANGVEGIKDALEKVVQSRAVPQPDDSENSEDNGPLIQLDYDPPLVASGHAPNLDHDPQKATRISLKKTSLRQYGSPEDARNLRKALAIRKLKAQQTHQRKAASPIASSVQPSIHVPTVISDVTLTDDASTKPTNANELPVGGDIHDDFQPLQDDDSLILVDDRAMSPIERILELEAETLAEQDKENLPQPSDTSPKRPNPSSVFDRQANAKRISFSSQPSTQQRPLTSSRPRRRTTEVDHDPDYQVSSPSEDNDFQRDQRVRFAQSSFPKTSSKRPAPIPESRSSIKRTRLSREQHTSSALDEDYRDSPVRTLEETPNPSQSDLYRAVNEQSRRTTALLPKKVQSRRVWSNEEMQALINLIQECGYSCALIKYEDGQRGKILTERSQTNIKDKARNMKFDYLKSGTTLPVNFEFIPLNKNLIERLRVAGVEVEVSDED